jgi:hypothetical protein
MFGGERIPVRGARVAINVENDKSRGTSGNPDVGVRPSGPPRFYLSEIDGCSLEAVCCPGMFSDSFPVGMGFAARASTVSDGVKRENKITILSVLARGIEQRWGGSALLERGHGSALTLRRVDGRAKQVSALRLARSPRDQETELGSQRPHLLRLRNNAVLRCEPQAV